MHCTDLISLIKLGVVDLMDLNHSKIRGCGVCLNANVTKSQLAIDLSFSNESGVYDNNISLD